jgi:NMD protein affecting ribosome stability and mRNA decay
MHICAPVSEGTNINDAVEAADIRPKIARWNRDKLDRRRLDEIRYNISIARNQLEMRSTASIIWQPYMSSAYQYEVDIQIAAELSIHRAILQYCTVVRV